MGEFRDRYVLAYSQFGKALARLHEAVDTDETPMVRDALIQRFEFTYELGWKCMFYWMRDEGEKIPEMVRPVLQAAFRCELIGDPGLWEKIKDSRNETSHTYNENKAIEVASFVRVKALDAFDALHARMQSL